MQEHPEVIANANALIHHFREKGAPLFHIRLAFDVNYQGLPKRAPNAPVLRENKKFLLNHIDTEFVPEIDVREGDVVLNKKYGDPFYKSSLLEHLQERKVDEVVFTGLATDNAILFGAHTALCNGFSAVVITDAIGASTRQAHDSALAIMKGRVVSRFSSTTCFLESSP